MIVVLTGGTGGAKLIAGLAAEIDPAGLTIITNTGDDCVFHGLNISPDIDTIIYTLAGVIEAIERANAIIVCPSNPITSIGPILAVPGIRAVLKEVKAPVVGVSPIIGQVAISGP